MTVHTIATTTHGRYLVEAAAGDAAGMLVGFHGQAETAAIEAVSSIDPSMSLYVEYTDGTRPTRLE